MENEGTERKASKTKAVSRGALKKDTVRRAPQRSVDRQSRDRVDDQREDSGDTISMEERDAMLRDEYLQNQLPNPPKKPGTHYFWGSTQNKYTPISWYLKLGYRPVRIDELPGFADAAMKLDNGEYAGCIGCNEMVLLRISEEGYQQIMRKIHHERATDEVGRIGRKIEETREAVGQDREGNDIVTEEGDGFRELERVARSTKRPKHFQ